MVRVVAQARTASVPQEDRRRIASHQPAKITRAASKASRCRWTTNGSRQMSHAPASPAHATKSGKTQHDAPTKAATAAVMPNAESRFEARCIDPKRRARPSMNGHSTMSGAAHNSKSAAGSSAKKPRRSPRPSPQAGDYTGHQTQLRLRARRLRPQCVACRCCSCGRVSAAIRA
jgi:hypothetical protein